MWLEIQCSRTSEESKASEVGSMTMPSLTLLMDSQPWKTVKFFKPKQTGGRERRRMSPCKSCSSYLVT